MESAQKNVGLVSATGWLDLVVASLKVAIVAFVVMQAKEWIDARSFDFLGVLVDALLIAAGVFIVNAILKLVRPDRPIAM